MSPKMHFAGTTFVAPRNWCDITDTLPERSPFTLAKSDGIGALQFSTATYRSGVLPNFEADDLRQLLLEQGLRDGLGAPSQTSEGRGANLYVGADFSSANEAAHFWFVTDGRNLVFITYCVVAPHNSKLTIVTNELRDIDVILRSLEFDGSS